VTASHTYTTAGTYSVVLTVTDDGGATGTFGTDVTLNGTHIGDLDAESLLWEKGNWRAVVTITVHDVDDNPVEDAMVTGTWSEGSSEEVSCIGPTDSSGQCKVDMEYDNIYIHKRFDSVTFTVVDVTHSTLAYGPGANHDGDDPPDSDGTEIRVFKDDALPANQSPVAGFTYTCTGLSCDFDASGSSDPDGTIVSYAWEFGDNSTGSEDTTSYTYATAGTYDVVLTVTDDGGAADTDGQSVSVAQTALTMHVGDLDAEPRLLEKGNWQASVTITVHDVDHNPVLDAMVTGTWSGGYSGTAACIKTTDSNGQCVVDSDSIHKRFDSVTFTVQDVTHGTVSSYDATANHDPDGDSDGTLISVSN
jgi:PKD repeat protein